MDKIQIIVVLNCLLFFSFKIGSLTNLITSVGNVSWRGCVRLNCSFGKWVNSSLFQWPPDRNYGFVFPSSRKISSFFQTFFWLGEQAVRVSARLVADSISHRVTSKGINVFDRCRMTEFINFFYSFFLYLIFLVNFFGHKSHYK